MMDIPFKSQSRGKHQRLPNGNRSITIPEQGQTIEVKQTGALVMEFNNLAPGKPTLNDDLVNVKRLPEGYFTTQPQFESLPQKAPAA